MVMITTIMNTPSASSVKDAARLQDHLRGLRRIKYANAYRNNSLRVSHNSQRIGEIRHSKNFR